MATHSSTLAWKIPWMEEPARPQSMGSLGVGHDWGLHFHFSLSYIGEGNGNPLQCSCLENPRDRGAWWAAVYGVAQSRTRLKPLSSMGDSERQRKPTVLQSTGLQRIRHDLATEQKQQLTSHSSYSTANLEGGGDEKKKRRRCIYPAFLSGKYLMILPDSFTFLHAFQQVTLCLTLFKVICVVNNHCLVEIISPLGEGVETGMLVK